MDQRTDRPALAANAHAVVEERAQLVRQAMSDYGAFVQCVWQKDPIRDPFILGRHTRAICDAVNEGVARLREGLSTYYMVVVPFRHGKSDLAARYLPGFLWSQNPDLEVMLHTYGQTLSEHHSRDAQRVIKSPQYQALVPHILLDPKHGSATEWGISGWHGKLHAVSVGGAQTGLGAQVLISDDPIRSRADAESQLIRDKAWQSLTDDTLTRLAPVHLCFFIGTRWHLDDPLGRLLAKQDPKSPHYDPAFPAVRLIHFRAREADGSYLFPERFPASWYEQQFAQLQGYSAAALLQGEPVLRGGAMLAVDRIQFVDEMPDNLAWVRGWDLASTEDERDFQDPDATAGARVAYTEVDGHPWLYIDDIRWCHHEALRRNEIIRRTALEDGGGTWQAIEAVAGYKDAYTTLRDILRGHSVVHPVNVRREKVVRYGELLEPVMAGGHVVMRRGAWNEYVIEEMAAVPAGVHDDTVDAVSIAAEQARRRWRQQGGLGARVGRGAI